MLQNIKRPYNGYPVYYGVVMGLCKVFDGLTMVLSLGYWYIDIELKYMSYENNRLKIRKGIK
jgi:hypothetical protein